MQLKAMIAEVNNTFDERPMYLLSTDIEQDTRLEETHIAVNSMNKVSAPKGEPFQYNWPKDLHVSPFSSRKCMYSLVAHNSAIPITAQPVEPKSREESIIDVKADLLIIEGTRQAGHSPSVFGYSFGSISHIVVRVCSISFMLVVGWLAKL